MSHSRQGKHGLDEDGWRMSISFSSSQGRQNLQWQRYKYNCTQGGQTIYTYGGGNPQVGITGGSMKYTGVTLSRAEINNFFTR